MNDNNEKYITLDSDFNVNEKLYEDYPLRIIPDKNSELKLLKDYKGRELYEIIQNADDACSPKVEVELTNEGWLHIRNWGDRPFTEKGLMSIMCSDMSPKESHESGEIKSIGNKGLGFRSLLNWGDEIIIYSNGVCCEFSKNIAKEKWNIIKTHESVKHKIDEYVKLEDMDTPIATLAIPKVSKDEKITSVLGEDNVDNKCTTDIVVHCNDDKIRKDIEEKINQLSNPILLFLYHIKEVSLILPTGGHRVMKIEGKDSAPIMVEDDYKFYRYRIFDDNRQYEYIVCRKFDKFLLTDSIAKSENVKPNIEWPCEIVVAYCDDFKDDTNVLYSYFPTKVRLDLKCIVHGNFILDSSRNSLIPSTINDFILEELGNSVLTLSEYIAKLSGSNNFGWNAYNMIGLGEMDNSLYLLKESLRNHISCRHIIPTLDGLYKTISECNFIDEEFAEWLFQEHSQYIIGDLNDHIVDASWDFIKNNYYINDKIKKWTLDDVGNEICEISKMRIFSIKDRVEFIQKLYDVLDGKNCCHLDVLIDQSGRVLEDNNDDEICIVDGGIELSFLPDLNIKLVNDELVDNLKKIWNCSLKDVANKLSKLEFVEYCDENRMIDRLVEWSENGMDNSGMKCMIKWLFNHQFNNDKVKKIYLYNRLGERKCSCELLLWRNDLPTYLKEKDGNNDSLWLDGDINYWKDFLGVQEEEIVYKFLYDYIGISKLIPYTYKYSCNDNEYLRSLRNSEEIKISETYFKGRVSDNDNYVKVACIDFFNDFSLMECLELMVQDENFINLVCEKQKLKSTKKYEPYLVSSYALYCLKKIEKFKIISQYVINCDKITSIGIDYNRLKQLSDGKIDKLLKKLGAKERLRDLSVPKLYELLAEKRPKEGIISIYQAIKDAIKDNIYWSIDDCRDRILTHVYARVNGIVEWLPKSEVYYWDQNQLPKRLLNTLPKLEIGSRVGCSSVVKIFGVKQIKNIKYNVHLKSEYINEELSLKVGRYLSERFKYILGYKKSHDNQEISDETWENYISDLKKLLEQIVVCSQCSYQFGDDDYMLDDGDMITDDKRYIICSKHNDFESSMNNPNFSESLTEILCIQMRWDSEVIINYFRNILTHNIEYVEAISEKDIDTESMKFVDKILGLSMFEKEFWEKVESGVHCQFDMGKLSSGLVERKKELLRVLPQLKLPEIIKDVEDMSCFEKYELMLSLHNNYGFDDATIVGKDGLCAYYEDKISELRDFYNEMFVSDQYYKTALKIRSLSNDEIFDTIKEYRDYCQQFANGRWIEDLCCKIKGEILSSRELEDILKQDIQKRFNFDDYNLKNIVPHQIKESYQKILQDNRLDEVGVDDDILMIGKFSGLEDLFNEKIQKYIRNVDCDVDNSVVMDSKLLYGSIKHIDSISNGINRGGNGHGKGSVKVSDYKKQKNGANAEEIVEKMMKNNPNFYNVQRYSSIGSLECGNDNRHYDLTYYKTEPNTHQICGERRYAEVKNMTGNYIIMSAAEYKFAKEHKEQYDFVIYKDGQVIIIESPFIDDKINDEIEPSQYVVPIDTKGVKLVLEL